MFCIFFQSTHHVDIKNGVECYKDFFFYFNALKTNCVNAPLIKTHAISALGQKNVTFSCTLDKEFPMKKIFIGISAIIILTTLIVTCVVMKCSTDRQSYRYQVL